MCQRILKRKRCVYNTGRSCQAHISCRLVGHTTDSSPTPTSSSLTGSCSDFQEAAQACYNDLGDMSDSIGNITLKTNRCVLSRKLSEITHLGNHVELFSLICIFANEWITIQAKMKIWKNANTRKPTGTQHNSTNIQTHLMKTMRRDETRRDETRRDDTRREEKRREEKRR